MSGPASRWVWFAGGLAIGAAILWISKSVPLQPGSQGGTHEPPSADGTPELMPAGEIAALGEALQEESEARRQLEWEVRLLGDLLAGLERRIGAGAERQPDADPETRPEASQPARDVAALRAARPLFDEEGLVDAGVDAAEASRIRERFEKAQLERLYLKDRATRGGWAGTRRHAFARLKIENDLREDLGEEKYDWMLFATGRNNRVVVRDVLGRSPAARAGFRSGDVILSYDGRRIFSTSALQGATTRGEPGEFVTVQVLRDGQGLTLSVPRGPLGTIIVETRQPPG